MESNHRESESEAQYADFQREFGFDDHTLTQCCLAALSSWDKVRESGKRSESFTKIIQGTQETFSDFFQRLLSAVNRIVSDLAVRKILIKFLAL